MAKRHKKSKKLSRHHVIPRSRGGTSKLENIVMLKIQQHQDYHILFANQTPYEIVETLVNKYWKGNWDYIVGAYNRNNTNRKI